MGGQKTYLNPLDIQFEPGRKQDKGTRNNRLKHVGTIQDDMERVRVRYRMILEIWTYQSTTQNKWLPDTQIDLLLNHVSNRGRTLQRKRRTTHYLRTSRTNASGKKYSNRKLDQLWAFLQTQEVNILMAVEWVINWNKVGKLTNKRTDLVNVIPVLIPWVQHTG